MDQRNRVTLPHSNERSIFHNARLKHYPDGSYEILIASRDVFRDPGWEDPKADEIRRDARDRAAVERDLRDLGWLEDEPTEAPKGPTEANLQRAARRAAAKLRDLALCNDFRWFVTLTLDRERIDRYNVKEITRKLNQWLDNQVRRVGLRYVFVPERHKDGAIHFHGFVNDVPGFVSSGTWKVPGHKKPIKPRSEAKRREWAEAGPESGYHEVFNWERWPLGFTTAVRLYGDYHSAVSYVCKYIRKQTDGGKIGGRWYYSGGELKTPDIVRYDADFDAAAAEAEYRFEVPEAHLSFCMVRGTYGGGDNTDLSSARQWVRESILQKPESQTAPAAAAAARVAAPAGAGKSVQKQGGINSFGEDRISSGTTS